MAVFFDGRGFRILKLGAWAERPVRVRVVPIMMNRPDRQEPGTGEGGCSPQSSASSEGVGEDGDEGEQQMRCGMRFAMHQPWDRSGIRRGRDGK